MEGPEISTAEAVIDNGRFGTRTIRFETGRLARQAAGSAVAYLDDDTMLLSATTASQAPQGPARLLPADGRRRGAHVRRGPHPRLVLPPRGPPVRGRDPHLPAHRPAAAPDASSRACATRSRSSSPSWRSTPTTCTTSSRSTPRRCRPSSPACRSPARSAPPASRSSRASGSRSRPTSSSSAPSSTWSSPAACVGDDVAIMMVEAEATASTIELVARRRRRADRGGRRRRASRPPSRSSRRCARRRPSSPRRPPSRPAEFPRLPRLPGRRARRRRVRGRRAELAQALTIAGKQEREAELDRRQGARRRDARGRSSRVARRRSPRRSAR